MDIRSVRTIGQTGAIVGRWRSTDPIPDGHWVESVRAGEYWLVRAKSRAAVALGRKTSPAKAASSTANGARGGRPSAAMDRLAQLRAAAIERRAQAYDSWLEVATASHVRKHWRAWMGAKPTWAWE